MLCVVLQDVLHKLASHVLIFHPRPKRLVVALLLGKLHSGRTLGEEGESGLLADSPIRQEGGISKRMVLGLTFAFMLNVAPSQAQRTPLQAIPSDTAFAVTLLFADRPYFLGIPVP